MLARIVHLALLLGVILGVVLPKTTAVLADLGLIDAGGVLICTGHGMERVRLDEQAPHRDDAPDDPACLLVHALDGAVPTPVPLWVRLAREVRIAGVTHLWTPAAAAPGGFARAPPPA